MWNELFPPLPPLNQERVEQLLTEYIPVLEECFGGTTDRPLQTQELTHAIVRDYPGTPDELKEHVNKWIIAWASQQGYILV